VSKVFVKINQTQINLLALEVAEKLSDAGNRQYLRLIAMEYGSLSDEDMARGVRDGIDIWLRGL